MSHIRQRINTIKKDASKGGKKPKYIEELIETLESLDKERRKSNDLTRKILAENPRLTKLKKMEFLEVYPTVGVVSVTAKKIEVSISAVGNWLKKDLKFRKKYDALKSLVTDQLEAEALRRALDKSDSLLKFLLMVRDPDRFNERKVLEANLRTDQPLNAPVTIVFGPDEIGPADLRMSPSRLNQVRQGIKEGAIN